MHVRLENLFCCYIIFLLILKYNRNYQCNTQKTENVTIFYCRADIFKYLYFPSTITDTTHIPSAITPTK